MKSNQQGVKLDSVGISKKPEKTYNKKTAENKCWQFFVIQWAHISKNPY